MYSHLLNQQAILKSVEGVNAYNEKTYTAYDVRCKIEFQNKLIVQNDGSAIASGAKVFMKESVKVGDIIEIDEVDYPVLQVEKLYDPEGGYVLSEANV